MQYTSDIHMWYIRLIYTQLYIFLQYYTGNVQYISDIYIRKYTKSIYSIYETYVQGGEDPYAALSCRSFSAKEPIIVGLFCGKRPIKVRHPMTLRHPVWDIYTRHVGAKMWHTHTHLHTLTHTHTYTYTYTYTHTKCEQS